MHEKAISKFGVGGGGSEVGGGKEHPENAGKRRVKETRDLSRPGPSANWVY